MHNAITVRAAFYYEMESVFNSKNRITLSRREAEEAAATGEDMVAKAHFRVVLNNIEELPPKWRAVAAGMGVVDANSLPDIQKQFQLQFWNAFQKLPAHEAVEVVDYILRVIRENASKAPGLADFDRLLMAKKAKLPDSAPILPWQKWLKKPFAWISSRPS